MSEIRFQRDNITFSMTFGGRHSDYGFSVQLTFDGGYIIAGSITANLERSDDVWLIKTDTSGIKQWDKTFGGTHRDYGHSVQQTSDGGYIIAGSTKSYGAGEADLWLIKTDEFGIKQWNRTFGGADSDHGSSVQQTSDGGYIIAGVTYSYGAGESAFWLIKTDEFGIEQWNKTFGGADKDSGTSLQQTSDGGFIITGKTNSYGAGRYDVWLIKTDESGKEQWNKTFGGSSHDFGNSVQQTSDGGYIITGSKRVSIDSDVNIWLIKTDESGKEQWNKTFGGSSQDIGNSVQQTSDRGYIIVGQQGGFNYDESYVWLIKTDESGKEQWNKTFGGGEYDEGISVKQTQDGGYIIVGLRTSYIGRSYSIVPSDVWLIKTDWLGDINSTGDLISVNLFKGQNVSSIGIFNYTVYYKLSFFWC